MTDKPWRRDMVRGTLNGAEVWAHWDLSCDHITRVTLGLQWTGKQTTGESPKPDMAHALGVSLNVCEAMQGRAHVLQDAIEKAKDLLSQSFEEDSKRRADELVEMAYEALRRVG